MSKILSIHTLIVFSLFFCLLCSCKPDPETNGEIQVVARVPEKVWTNQAAILIDARNSSMPGIQTRLSFLWSWLNVPAGVNPPGIRNTQAPETTIDSMPVPGVYILQLQVTADGALSRSRDFRIEVLPDSLVQYPAKADAGVDQSIMLPKSSLYLDGSKSQHLNPVGRSLTYSWTTVSIPMGSKEPVIESPTSAQTNVIGLTSEGKYRFALKVTNETGSFAMDTVTVTVLPDKVKGESVEFTVTWEEGLRYYFGLSDDDVGLIVWNPDLIIREREDYMEVRVWDDQQQRWHDPDRHEWILVDDGWGGILLVVFQVRSTDTATYYSVVGKVARVKVTFK